MNNNDILRSIRYILDLGDAKMMNVFRLADYHVTREQVCSWLKKDNDPTMQNCSDRELAIFLNGLINEKRGRKDGPQAEAEKRLNNNIVFRKLKIAFNLTGDDVLKIMALVGQKLSEHELSAFFRRPGHKHYRPCNDQILRYFLKGLQLQHRPPGSDVA